MGRCGLASPRLNPFGEAVERFVLALDLSKVFEEENEDADGLCL
jgi:hypothetical protein